MKETPYIYLSVNLKKFNMNKTVFLFLFCSVSIMLNAQRSYVPTTADLDRLLKSKTYVVLEASPLSEFNIELKDMMPRVWNLTDYDFLNSNEFEEKSTDPNFSFIYTSFVTFDRDVTDSRYVFLHLALGGENTSLNDLRDLISIPLGYAGVDPDNYNYKLGLFIKFIQNHINLIRERPDVISSNVFNHYNNNMADVKGKTLFLIEDELAKDVSTSARIKLVYPHKFELVDRDRIREAIVESDENVVFLHKVGPEGKKLKARCYKILIGAGDANFYYFHYHMISPRNPDGFLNADFRRLAKSR